MIREMDYTPIKKNKKYVEIHPIGLSYNTKGSNQTAKPL